MHSDKTVATIERLLSKGFDVDGIAARCGTSPAFVRNIRAGRRRLGGRYQHKHSARNDGIYRMRLDGWSQKQIAEAFNISQERVSVILDKYYGLKGYVKLTHKPKPPPHPQYDEIAQLWMQGGHARSIGILAEQFGISRGKVGQAIDRYLEEQGFDRETWELERGRRYMKEYTANEFVTFRELAQRHGVSAMFIKRGIERFQKYAARNHASLNSRVRKPTPGAAVGDRVGEDDQQRAARPLAGDPAL